METKTLCHKQILSILPDRQPDSHKGDYGRVLLLCGSRGYTGAPALAAMGALRTGAGLVYLGVPESIYEIEAIKLNEPVVFPLPDRDGMFSENATAEICKWLPKMDAVLIGPGIGQSQGSSLAVKAVLKEFSGPVVVDADGINVLMEHKNIVRGRTSATILTPHPGEFRRIGGRMDTDRIAAAAELAGQWNCTVLLKGHNTIVTDGVDCYSNPTGNPGMAVGGSGDVLAGMIVSLLGQGIGPTEAAACAAWLHGKAGDVCADQLGQYGMLPTDLLDILPRLMK